MTYNYSSTAGSYVLTGSVTSSATALVLDSVTGLPSVPFKVVLEPGTMNEEIVKVTNIAGFTLTVVRGWDGTSAVAHAALATVRHMMTAEDLRMSRQHEAATTAVHGLTGDPVGTSDTQALTNKDLSSATNIFPGSLATDVEVAAVSATLSSHTGATAAHGATGAVVGTTNAQALTNKDLTSGTNSFPPTLATAASLTAHSGASTGVHGVTGAVVGTTDTQTLSNKTLNSPDLNGTTDLTGTDPGAVVLNVKGAASQTAPLQSWRDSAGTSLTEVAADGKIWAPALAIASVDVPRIKIASFTATTDAQGFITTTHGFGFTPTAVMAYCNNPTSQFAALWGTEAIGATTFRTRWLKVDGDGALPSTSVSFTAIAFG